MIVDMTQPKYYFLALDHEMTTIMSPKKKVLNIYGGQVASDASRRSAS